MSGLGREFRSLPFKPAAISDAGVIVGSQNDETVRWENGALTVLPRIFGLPGAYTATAIFRSGLIVGIAFGSARMP